MRIPGEEATVVNGLWVTDDCVVFRLKLKQFAKFDSAQQAVEEASAIVESRVSPMLANMLEGLKDEKKSSLVVADPKLGMSCPRWFCTRF